MHLGNGSFAQSLEALKELLHSMRTPLGVALTIAKDSKNSLPLTPHDHEDAVHALEKIKALFDELRPLLNIASLNCVELSVSELLTICELEGYESSLNSDSKCQILVDTTLFKIWLSSFYQMQSDKREVVLGASPGLISVNIKFDQAAKKGPSLTFLHLLSAAFAEVGAKLEVLPEESKLSFGQVNCNS